MSERDYLNEIGRMSFGCGLGLLESSMLLEGISASFSGEGRVGGRGDAPDFKEIVDRLMANNAKAGNPVPREKVEEMVREDPEKYRRGAFRTPSVADIHNSMALNAPSASKVRDAYYKAAVATVGRIYGKYGIPFDKDSALKAVRDDDRYAMAVKVDRTAGVPRYKSFQMLIDDPTVGRLRNANLALKRVLGDALKFLKEGGEAKAEGRLDDYFEKVKNERFMMSLAAEPEKAYLAKNPVPEAEPDWKEKHTDFQYICDFAGRYENMGYPAVYERFRKVANPTELAAAPTPGETPYSYLARLQMPPGELPVSFAVKLNKNLNLAFTPEELQNAYMEVSSSPSRDIRDYFNAAKGEVEADEYIRPSDKKMYTVWKGFRDIDEACARLTGKPFFNR